MSKGVAIATWKFGQAAVAASGDVLTRGGTAMDAVEAGAGGPTTQRSLLPDHRETPGRRLKIHG